MSVKNIIPVEGFNPCRWPIRFEIPVDKREIVEVCCASAAPSLVCLVVEWRDSGHYEWLVYERDGIRCLDFSSAGFGTPEAAKREGVAILRQWVLEMGAEAEKGDAGK